MCGKIHPTLLNQGKHFDVSAAGHGQFGALQNGLTNTTTSLSKPDDTSKPSTFKMSLTKQMKQQRALKSMMSQAKNSGTGGLRATTLHTPSITTLKCKPSIFEDVEDDDDVDGVKNEHMDELGPPELDPKTEETISNLVSAVSAEGIEAECRARESRTNRAYWFLHDESSDAYKYYSWLLAKRQATVVHGSAQGGSGRPRRSRFDVTAPGQLYSHVESAPPVHFDSSEYVGPPKNDFRNVPPPPEPAGPSHSTRDQQKQLMDQAMMRKKRRRSPQSGMSMICRVVARSKSPSPKRSDRSRRRRRSSSSSRSGSGRSSQERFGFGSRAVVKANADATELPGDAGKSVAALAVAPRAPTQPNKLDAKLLNNPNFAKRLIGNERMTTEQKQQMQVEQELKAAEQAILAKQAILRVQSLVNKFEHDHKLGVKPDKTTRASNVSVPINDDIDEAIDANDGTLEHIQRKMEMRQTNSKAISLTDGVEEGGRHHLNDFLSQEELASFLAVQNKMMTSADVVAASHGGGTTLVTDYADNKLTEENPGYKLLQRMGWTEGKGLGATEGGILDPVSKGQVSMDQTGLGALSDLPEGVRTDFDDYRKRMMLAYRFRPNPLNNPRRSYY